MYSSMLWRRLPSPSITPNELLEILTAHTGGYYVLPPEPYDEVYPGIYLGDSTTALCLHLLKRIGITHVLNAACGRNRNLCMVNTSAGYYRNSGIDFLGIEAIDISYFPLHEHFYPAVEFIDRALRENGRVLVHCGEGISRSSTLVLAYLMIKRGLRVQDAVRQVVKHRNILPNQGFLLQLCQLHDQLQTSSIVPSPSPSPSTARSSVSPVPLYERESSIVPSRDSKSYTNTLGSSSSISRTKIRERCPSPVADRSWSNGWSPPPRINSPTSRYLRLPSNSPTCKYSPSNYSTSSISTTPLRSRRCQSVDREFASDNYNGSSRTYGSSLMSSYLGRPLYLASFR